VEGLEVGVVVDVAVEGTDDVRGAGRAARAVELLGVERVGVGLADDPDARPPGVTHDGELCLRRTQGEAQQLVVRDGSADGPGVVAQLADLRRRLVDEAQLATGGSHRTAPEQGVGLPGCEQRLDP
jgi:hypothetical protein